MIFREVTDRTFKQIIRSRILVLIDFWRDDCVPCKMMAPIINDLRIKYDGKIVIITANIKHCTKVVEQYNIKSAPTFLLFKDGIPVEKITGVVRESTLSKLLSAGLS